MNTDIDLDKSNIQIGDLQTNATFDSASRTLTLYYNGEMRDSYNYTVTFTDLVSKDGFNGIENKIFNNGVEVVNFNALYALPNPDNRNNYIGVNQGKIDIVFEENIVSGYGGITFKDSNGVSPKGGVTVTADGSKATVKFGELSDKTTYTLTVPDTIKGISGNYANQKTYTYQTLSKSLSEEEFSTWTDGSYTPSNGNFNKLNNSTLYTKLENTSKTSLEVKDSLLKITNSSETDCFIGSYIGQEITTAKIVTAMKFKGPETNASTTALCGFRTWQFSAGGYNSNYNGYLLSNSKFKNITTNAQGLYDVTISSAFEETAMSEDLSKTTVNISTIIKDNLSEASVSDVTSYTGSNSNLKTDSISAVKLYYPDSISIAYIKSGFYTIPDILKSMGLNANIGTITYIMNTDMNETTLSNIRINGEAVPYSGIESVYGLKIMATVWDMKTLAPLCSAQTKAMTGEIFIEAENFDESSTVHKNDFGGTATGGWSNGKYAVYKNVALTPYHTQLTVRLLPYQSGNIEVRANAVDGQLLGTIVIPEEDKLDGKGYDDIWSIRHISKNILQNYRE